MNLGQTRLQSGQGEWGAEISQCGVVNLGRGLATLGNQGRLPEGSDTGAEI